MIIVKRIVAVVVKLHAQGSYISEGCEATSAMAVTVSVRLSVAAGRETKRAALYGVQRENTRNADMKDMV